MKKIIIVAVVAVLVFSGALAGVLALINTPERVAARAVTGMLEDLVKRDEIAPLENVLTKGSVAFEADSKTLDDLVGDKLAVGGKLYFGKDAFMMDDLRLTFGENKLTGSLYLDQNHLYVKNAEIMGGAWGLERGNLAQEWEDSVFAPKSGTDVALAEEEFKTVTELLTAIDEELDRELEKDLEKLVKRYGKKVWKVFCENAEFESETGSVRINKERKNARTITITLDGDALGVIVEDMVDYIVNDDKLRDLVIKYGDRFADMLEAEFDIEDIADTYDEWMEELEDSVDDIVDGIEVAFPDDIVVTLVTPTMNSDLLMLAAEYDDQELFAIEFGHKGLRKTDCISVKLGGVFDIVYAISEDSKDEYKSTLEVEGEKVATLEIDRDKDNFELDIIGVCKVEGDMSSKGKTHTITVDSVTVDGEKFAKLGITVIFKEKDEMPEAEDKVKSLLTLDEEELKKWNDRLEDMDLISFLGGLSGTYSAESFGKTVSYKFLGNKVTMTTSVGESVIREQEGTYEILEGTYGSDKIILDFGFGPSMFLFEKDENYIVIDGIRYTRVDTK